MPRAPSLKVPFALTGQGEEIRPEQATKGMSYTCPSCHTGVRVRGGAIKRVHFAHEVDPERCDFVNETESHLRAKWAISNAVQGNRPLQFRRRCSSCAGSGVQSLPASVAKAQLEYALPSGHRADVALLDESGQLRALIEVFCTHAVDDNKRQALDGIRWAEVKADDVLSGQAIPLQQDQFAPFTCQRCRQIERFGATFSFTGHHKQQVQCPIPGRGLVNIIDVCAGCSHFVTVQDQAIFCVGRGHGHGGI